MRTFDLTTPDGKTFELEVPDNATSEQIQAKVGMIKSQYQPPQSSPSLMRRGWDALTVPEQKSREGLQMLAELTSPRVEATGNMARDLAFNAPRIGLESLAQVAPGFISRESLLTAGILKGVKIAKPAIKGAGGLVAKGAEAMSGLEHRTPGMLKEAATKFPTLEGLIGLIKNKGLVEGTKSALQQMPLFVPGTKSASPIYEAGKKAVGDIRPMLKKISGKKEFVEKVIELSGKKKGINPTEALEARKELNAIKKTVTGEYFRTANEKLDSIAKQAFTEADVAYKEGIKADNLRNILAQNKYGGSSRMASTLAGAAGTAIGLSGGGIAGGLVPLAVTSPIVQGAAATGIGATARTLSPLLKNTLRSGSALAGIAKSGNDPPPLPFSLKPDIEALSRGEKVLKKEANNETIQAIKKPLGRDKAKEYFRDAYKELKTVKNKKERESKARDLANERAIKDGYDTSPE